MRKWHKRVISSLLVVAVLVTLLPVVSKTNVSYAAEEPGKVVRGVVDQIEQLPQYGIENYQLIERGTPERPFVILEIVPYEEMAEFGYHIGGCEPIDIEGLFGRNEMGHLKSLLDAEVEMHTAYFFPDEPEGKQENYDNTLSKIDWMDMTVNGYYEVVEEGSGNFTAQLVTTEGMEAGGSPEEPQEAVEAATEELLEAADAAAAMKETLSEEEADAVAQMQMETLQQAQQAKTQINFVPTEGGNLIWHTVNDFEMDAYEAAGIPFNGDPTQRLQEIGDRFYTTRSSSGNNRTIMCSYNYYTYKNNEHFLMDTLELTEEEAAAYSIVIKTITPEELNQSVANGNGNDWIEYADLISLSGRSHDNTFLTTWQKYNRLGHEASLTNFNLTANEFQGNKDFSWDTTLKIYNKVTAETDYAAIVMDDGIYNTFSGYNESHGAMDIDILDWNMQSSGLRINRQGYSNNVYKLAVMLFSMKSELFRSLYLSGDNPIIQNGKNTKQTGEAAEYWNFYTFLPAPTEEERLLEREFKIYDYWNTDEVWANYRITPEPSNESYKYWTAEHVFSYKGENNILRGDYITQILRNVEKFTEFQSYLQENGITDPNTSDAIRFILGIRKTGGTDPEQEETLRVLDIEPSVDLKLSSDGKYQSDWQLTEAYIRRLAPSFTGKIEITHQTTAEFNGKVEDLNSTYDMIFLGLDYGAYNTANLSVRTNAGISVNGNFPNWNDNSMDGKIYCHMGDSMQGAEIWTSNNTRNRSVKFLWDTATGTKVNSAELRFPGNDISTLKCKELEEFVRAGYPIVATRYLYDLEKGLVDEKSNVYQFVQKYRAAGASATGEAWNQGVYAISQTEEIKAALGNLQEAVTFTGLPALYDGSTQGTSIANPNYLPIDSGRSYLEFHFHVRDAGYSYNVYVDSDRDGKFTQGEIIHSGPANGGEDAAGDNAFVYRLPTALVGLLQWKIEVFRTDRPEIRYMETGCSAARNTTGVKKQVNVLQIMPKDGTYSGCLNLETSELFRRYYKDLVDYDIHIKSITWDEYSDYFDGSNFHYDLSKEIGVEYGNPVNEEKISAEANLSGYNMIIVGFGDAYGEKDLSDIKAVEYLEYFIAQGKSVLFTHDVTSMYNMQIGNVFGSTANAMLRDVMGMNRYKAVSNTLSNQQRDSLIAYQNLTENNYYDTIDSTAKQGFSYYALKRLGWGSNANNNNQVPYHYMIRRAAENNSLICKFSSNGFNNNNDVTTEVSRLNEGQITVYPYKIDDNFTIAKTHAQWYQLNVEDPEVTVWYCLDNDDKAHGWDATDNNGDGTALTYAVSPNDASNNYYIYSKGNVFYSGVGHSEITGDMEAKLFINTMIAAYRASYEAPVFEITNKDAILNGAQNYTLEVMQEFDNGTTPAAGQNYAGENAQIGETFTDNDTVKVTFMPIDYNPIQTSLTGEIYLADGEHIDKIYSLSDDTLITANAEHKFIGLENGKEYYLYYKKSWLDTHRVVKFELKNDRNSQKSTTILNMTVQPLFELD